MFWRTPKGAVQCGEKVKFNIFHTNITSATVRIWDEFTKQETYYFMENVNNHHSVTVIMPNHPTLLWFCIKDDNNNYFLGNPDNSFQITVYQENTDSKNWFFESILYQIFPDRFAKNGNISSENPKYTVLNWDDNIPNDPTVENTEFAKSYFYGGNINGIINKLPYLEDLGVNCIYLNPICESYSNHHYDTGDYTKIHHLLGDWSDFSQLTSRIPVILDGVFNHTGADSLYFNKYGNYQSVGAFQSENSPYANWYSFSKFPCNYESWWGIPTLPSIRKDCVEFRDFIVDTVIPLWLQNGIKGLRLDVVDELSEDMLNSIHNAMQKTDNNVLIGEVWEDASNKIAYGHRKKYFFGGQLDGVMNYPFRDAIIRVIKGDVTPIQWHKIMSTIVNNYPKHSLMASMNLLGSHDVSRISTLLGNTNNVKLAVLWQMTFLGVPTIYYGDEVGMFGDGDPYCRKPMEWNKEKQNVELFQWYKELISIRKTYKALIYGDYQPINRDDILAYKRILDDQVCLILLNVSDTQQTYFFGKNAMELLSKTEVSGQFNLSPKSGYVFLI